jgi:hypothetical protein
MTSFCKTIFVLGRAAIYFYFFCILAPQFQPP